MPDDKAATHWQINTPVAMATNRINTVCGGGEGFVFAITVQKATLSEIAVIYTLSLLGKLVWMHSNGLTSGVKMPSGPNESLVSQFWWSQYALQQSTDEQWAEWHVPYLQFIQFVQVKSTMSKVTKRPCHR